MENNMLEITSLVNRRVKIVLKNHRTFIGYLKGYDTNNNLILFNCEECEENEDGHEIIIGRNGPKSVILFGYNILTIDDDGPVRSFNHAPSSYDIRRRLRKFARNFHTRVAPAHFTAGNSPLPQIIPALQRYRDKYQWASYTNNPYQNNYCKKDQPPICMMKRPQSTITTYQETYINKQPWYTNTIITQIPQNSCIIPPSMEFDQNAQLAAMNMMLQQPLLNPYLLPEYMNIYSEQPVYVNTTDEQEQFMEMYHSEYQVTMNFMDGNPSPYMVTYQSEQLPMYSIEEAPSSIYTDSQLVQYNEIEQLDSTTLMTEQFPTNAHIMPSSIEMYQSEQLNSGNMMLWRPTPNMYMLLPFMNVDQTGSPVYNSSLIPPISSDMFMTQPIMIINQNGQQEIVEVIVDTQQPVTCILPPFSQIHQNIHPMYTNMVMQPYMDVYQPEYPLSTNMMINEVSQLMIMPSVLDNNQNEIPEHSNVDMEQ